VSSQAETVVWRALDIGGPRQIDDLVDRAAELSAARSTADVCRLVLDIRLISIAFTVFFVATGPNEPPWLLAALIATMVGSYWPLRDWERLGPMIARHPMFLAVDVLLALGILAYDGSQGPFFYFTVATSLLAGLLYGWRGALLFATMLMLGYVGIAAVEVDSARAAAVTFHTAVGLPALYPLCAAAGVGVRSLLIRQADIEAALRDAIQSAAAAEERARLAREMHDSVAKTLHGIALSATALAAAARVAPDTVEEQARQLAASAGLASAEGRRLIEGLRADRLDVPLGTSVRELVESWSRDAVVPVDMSIDEDVAVGVGARFEVVSLLREALRNVGQHAGATHATVALARADGWVSLRVSDDGVGFVVPDDLAALHATGHYGIVGMHERARRAGGRLVLESTPRCGTSVTVRVPAAQVHERVP